MLLICPKPLVTNWQREFAQWAAELTVNAIEGGPARRQWQWRSSGDVVTIANYETVVRDRDEVGGEVEDAVELGLRAGSPCGVQPEGCGEPGEDEPGHEDDPGQRPGGLRDRALRHGDAEAPAGLHEGLADHVPRAGPQLQARRVRRRTGLELRDLGPMRAAGREALLSLNLADRRFGYPLEMVMSAAAAGWRVSEVEVTYLPRIGKSKVTGTVRGCARTVRDMSQVLAQ